MILAEFRQITEMKINKSIRNKCYSPGWSNALCCTWTKRRFTILFMTKHDGPIYRGVVPDILSVKVNSVD